jgi:hypothetical protein
MLIRLLPEQVIREWEVVEYAIKEANYEQMFDSDEAIRDHLRHVVLGTMQVWAIVNGDDFAGIGVSRFNTDTAMGVKRLEIYSLYAFKSLSPRTWATCFVVLQRFARANGCSHIMAISDNESVISLAEKMGGDTAQRMIVFDL